MRAGDVQNAEKMLNRRRRLRFADPLAAGLATLTIFWHVSAARAADAPEIAVEAAASEIYVGESVDYFVEIRNAKDPSPPDISALRELFTVEAAGDESRNQSSTFVINGKVTQQNRFSHVYRFRLTPKRAGDLVIPAPSATIEARKLSGRALPLKVIAPQEQDLVVPEIMIDRAAVYPTQPFEVTLRVLIHPLPNDADRDPVAPLRRRPPHLDVNWVDPPKGLAGDEKNRWLEKLLTDEGGFTLNEVTMRTGSLFDGPRPAVFNLYVGRQTRKGLDGAPVKYFAYELKRTFTPEKTGTYQFGPAIVKGSFVEGIEGRSYSARRLVAIAPAATLEVRDVPSPRPASFCGGIGTYHVAASASPTTLRVGDPLTLTIEMQRDRGSGSLELIGAPDLSANPQLAADFEIIDKNPTGRTEGEVKRFAYALRPKRAGGGIPALSVSVFNPDTESFSEMTTSPIPLEVSETGRMSAGDLVGSLGGSSTPEIKSREQGIFQNITDPSQLADERVNVPLLAGAAFGAWCAVAGLFSVVGTHRRKSSDLGWRRRQQARRAANHRLAEARSSLADARPEAALRAVRAAVVGIIADMRNIVAEGLTAADADAALAQAGVAEDQRETVLRLLQSIESAEYGSGSASEASNLVEAAAAIVPRLARSLERSAQ